MPQRGSIKKKRPGNKFSALKKFLQKNLTKNCRFGIPKRIWRNRFSFARLALPMKDSSDFFRLKESTGKRTNSKADRLVLPEEECCRVHALRGPAIKAYGINYQSRLGGEARRRGGWAPLAGRSASPQDGPIIGSEKESRNELPGRAKGPLGKKGFANFYGEGGAGEVESSRIASREHRL